MERWLSYSPQDFLLFSDRVYWRLFELHNAALWPGQIPAFLAGLAVAALLIARPARSAGALAALLAAAWAIAGLTFLPRYATVNWIAGGLVPIFLAQAALLAGLGYAAKALDPRAEGARRWVALGLTFYGLAVHPAVAAVTGRGLAGVEWFALTPDPTAIVTLGVVLAGRGRWPTLILAAIPLAWCLASWATLATLGAVQAWTFVPVALAVVAAACLPERART